MPATAARTSEAINARSSFRRLMPQNTAAALKPSGAQMEPGICLNFNLSGIERHFACSAHFPCSQQPLCFRIAAHDIETLNRLAARAFHQVVDRAHKDEAAGARIEAPRDVDKVCSSDVFCVRKKFVAK